jgi:hypothetical protein
MLHTELLRLINSRETWAFVGSGPSIEAGCPNWEQLLENATNSLSAEVLATLNKDSLFIAARKRHDLPAAFMAIEPLIGREALEACVADSLKQYRTQSPMYKLLADLPFAGYVTTNYDGLLVQSLNGIDPGWAPVGNVGDEVRKASGTAERVVWHIHGAADLETARSRLILTTEDYEQLYLDGSRVLEQLKGLLAHRRIVIVGFGFRDLDVMHTLRTVGRLTDATRPIFALVEKVKDFRHQIDRQVFLRQYKIDVQPYRNDDGNHQNLRQMLSVYASMSLRRSLRFGRHLSAPPEYDPETTGLLIYNDLVLNDAGAIPQALRTSILKARILSLCEVGPRTKVELGDDLTGLLETLIRRIAKPVTEAESRAALNEALAALVAEGLLTSREGEYELSLAGRESVLDHAASAARLEEQFEASIRTRAQGVQTLASNRADGVLKVVNAFFHEAIRRRALGVALAFATGGAPAQQDYHALALLQSMREWLDTANDEAEALAVVETIQGVFRQPTPAEKAYVATAIQARFVLHLLSLDDDTLAARRKELADSLFLIDSSTLIPWLATSSAGSLAATALIRRLQELGAAVATTWPLAEEVAEHARWAQRTIREAGGVQAIPVFEAATGRAGMRTNAFLEGFLSHYGADPSAPTFDRYLASCLAAPSVSNPVTDEELLTALGDQEIAVLNFSSVAAQHDTLGPERSRYFGLIRDRRVAAASYRHDRQVRAEAEAVALVEKARIGNFNVDSAIVSNGYFISYTSMLNQVAGSNNPITMRPEAALSWLATIRPASSDDVQAIISELLWELQERRMNLVDQDLLLNAFGPLIAASRERLEEVLPKYQALVAQRYGGGMSEASAVKDLDLPVVLESVLFDRVDELQRQVAHQAAELEVERSRGAMSEAERGELDRLRLKERRRRRYHRRTKGRSSGDGKGGDS